MLYIFLENYNYLCNLILLKKVCRKVFFINELNFTNILIYLLTSSRVGSNNKIIKTILNQQTSNYNFTSTGGSSISNLTSQREVGASERRGVYGVGLTTG